MQKLTPKIRFDEIAFAFDDDTIVLIKENPTRIDKTNAGMISFRGWKVDTKKLAKEDILYVKSEDPIRNYKFKIVGSDSIDLEKEGGKEALILQGNLLCEFATTGKASFDLFNCNPVP